MKQLTIRIQHEPKCEQDHNHGDTEREAKCYIKIDGNKVEQVEAFKILGVLIKIVEAKMITYGKQPKYSTC